MSKAKVMVALLALVSVRDAAARQATTPEVRVSATRLSASLADSGARITLLDGQTLRSSGVATVADLLRDEAGLTVVSQGGQGQLTQAYFRGLPAGQTLVFIDGVKVNDPSNPDRLFDFANLGVASIERIEIVHGAPAEIRIHTRKAQGSAHSSEATIFAGSYGTLRSRADIQGYSGSSRYRLGIEQLQASGFSAASGDPDISEADSRSATALTASGSRAWGALGETSASLRWALSRTELDAFDGTRTLDDPDHLARERGLQLNLTQQFHAGEGWEFRASAGAVLSRRQNENPPASTGAVRSQSYFGGRTQAELAAIRNLDSGLSVSLFSELESEQASFDDGVGAVLTGLSQQIRSLGAGFDGLKLTPSSNTGLSVRLMSLSGEGSSGATALTALASHRLQLFQGILARGSIASGARFPTLYQLHADLGSGFGGNPALQPEQSLSLDAGLEWARRNLTASLGVFANRIRDQIQFTAIGYENLASTRTDGLEARLGMQTGRSRLRGHLTWLAVARDELTGDRLPQRPRVQWAMKETYEITPRLDLQAGLRFHGSRVAGVDSQIMPSYTLLDAGVGWRLSRGLSLSARIENLTDRIYEEVPGYGTARRSIFAGIEGRMD
jgi:vitamin B12 transporter